MHCNSKYQNLSTVVFFVQFTAKFAPNLTIISIHYICFNLKVITIENDFEKIRTIY